VVDAKKTHGLADATVEDLEWRLRYLLAVFDRHELHEIDVPRVDDFRDELARRSQEIRAAADRGTPLMETIEGRQGRSYKREKRALSNSSINKLLELLGLIMQRAVDYEYIARNPVRVGQRSQRFLPTPKKSRTYLEVDELKSLLDAAGELDRAVQRAHRIGPPRRDRHAEPHRLQDLRAVHYAVLASRPISRTLQAPRREDPEGRARGRDDRV
jgi:hypothetical protein